MGEELARWGRRTRVVVVVDGWAKGEHGFLLKRAESFGPGWVTVQLDSGRRFAARRGDVELESRVASSSESSEDGNEP